VCGIGINDADYAITVQVGGKRYFCPLYAAWRSMLRRCYTEDYHNRHPTYADCAVCEDWHVFSVFRAWAVSQDWQDKQLDKDILCPGNKVYSAETCVFVTNSVNNLLSGHAKWSGDEPVGVYHHRDTPRRKPYSTSCFVFGKPTIKRYFATSQEASKVYSKTKGDEVTRVAMQQTDIRVRAGLLLHAKLYYRGEVI